jgi:hypothetical protein
LVFPAVPPTIFSVISFSRFIWIESRDARTADVETVPTTQEIQQPSVSPFTMASRQRWLGFEGDKSGG